MYQALIAEDSTVFREMLHAMLARHFPLLSVEEAVDGDQALEKATARHHDLVLTDIKMPGHSGLEIARAVKASDPRAVVVIVTSHDLPEYREAARCCGADHFIVKNDAVEEAILGVVAAAVPGVPRRRRRN